MALNVALISLASILIAFISIWLNRKRVMVKALDIKEPLKELSTAKGVQEVAASQLTILGEYYNNVLSQSQRSFYFALISAGIGLLFIIAAASFLLLNQLQELALITMLGSVLSGFVSGVNFYLYNKSSSQMEEFHSRLETTQRFLLADSLCNSITDTDKKNETRCDLIKTIAKINTEPSTSSLKSIGPEIDKNFR